MKTVAQRAETKAGGKRIISNHKSGRDTKRSLHGVYDRVSKYPSPPDQGAK